ncbi:MAG: hypothetical protein JJ911_07815 [Rhizobiaceae bacterium]|nr:hypothetical protein [Rhizobiaceae bacterium]
MLASAGPREHWAQSERPALCRSADDFYRPSGDITHLVERWNHSARLGLRTDCENYVNGDRKFLLEYVGCRWNDCADETSVYLLAIPRPREVAATVHSCDDCAGVVRDWRDVGDKCSQLTEDDPFVVTGWDGKPVLVEGVEFMNGVKQIVPSIFTMGFQINKSLKEGWRDPIGESIFHGTIKPCGGFAEGELDGFLLAAGLGERRDDFPIGMIKSGTEVMDYIGRDVRRLIYDGYIAFGAGGSFEGAYVRANDVAEGSLLVEQLVELADVFRGPINLA